MDKHFYVKKKDEGSSPSIFNKTHLPYFLPKIIDSGLLYLGCRQTHVE